MVPQPKFFESCFPFTANAPLRLQRIGIKLEIQDASLNKSLLQLNPDFWELNAIDALTPNALPKKFQRALQHTPIALRAPLRFFENLNEEELIETLENLLTPKPPFYIRLNVAKNSTTNPYEFLKNLKLTLKALTPIPPEVFLDYNKSHIPQSKEHCTSDCTDPAWHNSTNTLMVLHGWSAERWVRRYGEEFYKTLLHTLTSTTKPWFLTLAHSGRFAEWKLVEKILAAKTNAKPRLGIHQAKNRPSKLHKTQRNESH